MKPALAHDFAPESRGQKVHCQKHGLPLPPVGWLMSEKFQGVRACWDPSQRMMRTRTGNRIQIPQDWHSALPSIPLDGEIMALSGGQDATTGLIQKRAAMPEEWVRLNVRFFVFGTFGSENPEQRNQQYQQAIAHCEAARLPAVPAWVVPVKHTLCTSISHFEAFKQEILDRGGEGVMLLAPKGEYPQGRTRSLLKSKGEDTDVFVVKSEVIGKRTGQVMSVECYRNTDPTIVCRAALHKPVPEGTFEQGQRIEVKYLGVSRYGVPRNPRVLFSLES